MRLLRCLWTGNNETAVEVAYEEHGDPIPPYEYLSHRWSNDGLTRTSSTGLGRSRMKQDRRSLLQDDPLRTDITMCDWTLAASMKAEVRSVRSVDSSFPRQRVLRVS